MVDRSLLDANIGSVSIDGMLVSVNGSTPYRVKMLATIREARDFAVKLINIEMDVEVLQVEISSSGSQKHFFLSNCVRSGRAVANPHDPQPRQEYSLGAFILLC